MTRPTRPAGQARLCGVAAVLAAVVAALIVLPRPTTSPAEAQACSLAPTTGTEVRTVGGRPYHLHVPAGLPGPRAMLVVSLHPYTGDPAFQERVSQLSTAADEDKFIVAYPEGRLNAHQSFPWFRGWDPTTTVGNPDLNFILSVVDDISDVYCVDPAHVHVEGFSLGAAMAQRAACSAPDVFASGMSHATSAGPSADFIPCAPARPISIFLSCPAEDEFGIIAPAARTCIPQRDAWREVLGNCPLGRRDDPDQLDDRFGWFESLAPCRDGTQIARRVWADLDWTWDVDHNYPQGAALDQYHFEMWFFFQMNPKP